VPACDEIALKLEQMIPYTVLGSEPAYRGLMTKGYANKQVLFAGLEEEWLPNMTKKRSCFRSGANESSTLFTKQYNHTQKLQQTSKEFSDFLLSRAGIFKQAMGARNRGGIGLSYRPARLNRLSEFTHWNRFPDPIKVQKYGLWKIR
jgi:hypothetical protein